MSAASSPTARHHPYHGHHHSVHSHRTQHRDTPSMHGGCGVAAAVAASAHTGRESRRSTAVRKRLSTVARLMLVGVSRLVRCQAGRDYIKRRWGDDTTCLLDGWLGHVRQHHGEAAARDGETAVLSLAVKLGIFVAHNALTADEAQRLAEDGWQVAEELLRLCWLAARTTTHEQQPLSPPIAQQAGTQAPCCNGPAGEPRTMDVSALAQACTAFQATLADLCQGLLTQADLDQIALVMGHLSSTKDMTLLLLTPTATDTPPVTSCPATSPSMQLVGNDPCVAETVELFAHRDRIHHALKALLSAA
eukprot:m.485225 g.485225  ORF g.485225 m.485225 type:complete len:305 (-) comp23712_c0_seq1:50-964(-)